ncbi:hypothetical protein COT97_01150 [Candidatus Falkowbacteria bacterium CG10_big_fil_rev_8_21_14_0_10_39_11]|uniref:Uncharacterized protein n=1 Tax=Candidatus Falkowbacteria bacterium CG10_big_fil_rev_8_21_14_0_10_39_11 TaxID=1974565 RepID=A0A2H0V5R2_9BACT|nr:MAG: hypothetical protein COT97_01150 [Candidatus Falkowbacteria bacterium CG10_big_fil_rev_8_21_14_0_10_39_11]
MEQTKNFCWITALVVFHLSILFLIGSYYALYLNNSSFDQEMSSYLIINEPEYIKARDLPVNFSHFFNYGYVEFPQITDVVNPILTKTLHDSFLSWKTNFTHRTMVWLLVFLMLGAAITTYRFLRLRKIPWLIYSMAGIILLQIVTPLIISHSYGKKFEQRQKEFMARVHEIKDQSGVVKFSARGSVHDYQVEDKEMFNEIIMKIESDFADKGNNLIGNYSFLILVADSGIALLSVFMFFAGLGLRHVVVWIESAFRAVAVRRYIAGNLIFDDPTVIVSRRGVRIVQDERLNNGDFHRAVLAEHTVPDTLELLTGRSGLERNVRDVLEPVLTAETWNGFAPPGEAALSAYLDSNVQTFGRAADKARNDTTALSVMSDSHQVLTRVSRESVQHALRTCSKEFKGLFMGRLEDQVETMSGKLNRRLASYIESQGDGLTNTTEPIPDGTRFMVRRGNHLSVVIEQRPTIRSLIFTESFLDMDLNHNGQYNKAEFLIGRDTAAIQVALPYVVFIIHFVNGMAQINNVQVFYRNEALTSLDDVVCGYNLPNIGSSGNICLRMPNVQARTVSGQIREILQYYWSSRFNNHLPQSYLKYANRFPQLQSIATWHRHSMEDPNFVLHLDWDPIGTVSEHINRAQPTDVSIAVDVSDIVRSTVLDLGDDLVSGMGPVFSRYIKNGYRSDQMVEASLERFLETIRTFYLRRCRELTLEESYDPGSLAKYVDQLVLRSIKDAVSQRLQSGLDQVDVAGHIAADYDSLIARLTGQTQE